MHRPTEPEYYGAVKFVLSDHSWQYRGEGNSHIAISLPLEKKIILLSKSDNTVNHQTDTLESWRNMKTNIAFISSVMKQIVGEHFVSCPSLVYLTCDDIAFLNESLVIVRPENRLHKMLLFCGAELSDDFSFLPKEMSDLCQNMTVSVELKPKQGIFPLVEMRNRNCTFCCKQQLKLKDGLVSKRSEYCPLDLFSGCPLRMKHAVKSLLKSPQNNLRIFHEGNLVFDERVSTEHLEPALANWLPPASGLSLVERFSSLLLQALTKDMNCSSICSLNPSQSWVYDGLPPSDKADYSKKLKEEGSQNILGNISQQPCNYDRQDLPEGSILHAIAQAQGLDQFGIAEILNMVNHCNDSSHKSNTAMKTGIEYVHNLLEKGCSSRLNAIELYLIAAVVRDCSILITFQEMQKCVQESCLLPQIEDKITNTRYLVKISAVDLNPKRFSTIASHALRNKKIIEAIQSDFESNSV